MNTENTTKKAKKDISRKQRKTEASKPLYLMRYE